MKYELEYSKKAQKQINSLNSEDSKRILKVLERVRFRPYNYVKKLVGIPYFRVRVGNLRIIVDIEDDKLVILVLEIGNRKNIYKWFFFSSFLIFSVFFRFWDKFYKYIILC